jgi:hypothetical protein
MYFMVLLLSLLLWVGASSIACALDVHSLDCSSSSRVLEGAGLQRPGGLVIAEDDAGRRCLRVVMPSAIGLLGSFGQKPDHLS